MEKACHPCSNDAFDAAMGVDAGKPESIVNLTGDRVSVLWAANGFLAAGLAAFVQALLVPVSEQRGREPNTLISRSNRAPALPSSRVSHLMQSVQWSLCCVIVYGCYMTCSTAAGPSCRKQMVSTNNKFSRCFQGSPDRRLLKHCVCRRATHGRSRCWGQPSQWATCTRDHPSGAIARTESHSAHGASSSALSNTTGQPMCNGMAAQ